MLLLLLISLLASAHAAGYLKGGSIPSAFQVQQATVQDTLRGALSGSDIQQPYSFSFESGGSSGKTYRQETGDASGLVQGLYTVSDPRGHSRVVQYTADEHGFHADIQTDEPHQQSHSPANVRFVSTGRKGSTASLYSGSQVKGGGRKTSVPSYKIGQSRIPYGASGLDFYSYPDERYTQSRKGTGISKTSGPFGQQKVAPGDISQGKLHFTIGDSQQKSPAFLSSTKGSYRTGKSQIPYGLSGFDYYSYPSHRHRTTKTSSLSTKASGFGSKGVSGRGGVSPAFLGSTGISSTKGTGSGSGPFVQRQVQFKLGDSDISYKIGQSQIPYGASGLDFYSYPAQRYRQPQVKSPSVSKTSRFGAKGGTGGGIGPAFLGTTGVSSVKGVRSPAVPSKTFRGVSQITGGSAKASYQFKLGESDISYKIGQSQIPYGASGLDFYSYPAQRYRRPQVKSPTVSKISRFGAKGGSGSGIGPAFLGSTGVSSVKGVGSGSSAVPSKTFRGVSQVTGGSAKGSYQFKLGESDISYKIGQSQIPYGASGLDYYSYPAQRYRGPQVKSPTVSKISRFGAKGGSGSGIGPAFLGSTGVSSVKGTGSGSAPFAQKQVQERISPAVPSKTFRGVSQVRDGTSHQFKLGDAQVAYKIGQSQIPYGASGLDFYSYPAFRQTPAVGKTSRSVKGGIKGPSLGGLKGGIGSSFRHSSGIGKGTVSAGAIKGGSQISQTAFGIGDVQRKSPAFVSRQYHIGQSQIPYGASGLDYYSYPEHRHRQTKSSGVKGGSPGIFLGASSGGIKGASQGSLLRTASIKGAAQSSHFGSSSGSIKGSTKGSFPGASLGSFGGGIKTDVGSQKRPYSIGQSSIPYGASGFDFSSYPTQRLTFSHGSPTFSTKTPPSLHSTAGGLSGVKSVAGSRIKGGYGSVPSRKGRDTSSLSKINRGSIAGQEKINIKLLSEVAQGKIEPEVPIAKKSAVLSGTKTAGGITRKTVIGDGSTGKTVVSQVKTYTGDIGGTKSSVSGIKTKTVGSSTSRKTAGLYKVSQEKVGQEKVGQEKVGQEKAVQSDIGGQSGGTIGSTLGLLNVLPGQRQGSSLTGSSTGSQIGVSGRQSDVSFSLGGEQIVSAHGGSTGTGGISATSSTAGGASAEALRRRGVSSSSASYSSDFSQGLRSGYSTYDSSENPAKIEFSLGGGQGFSTYGGASGQSGGSSSGAIRRSGVSLGDTRSGTSSVATSGGVTSSQLSYIDRARSRTGTSGIGASGGRRATTGTGNVGQSAAGFQRASLSRHRIGSDVDNPAKIELSLGDGHGFSTYGVSGLSEAVSAGDVSGLGEAVYTGGITAGTTGGRAGAALRSHGGTSTTIGGSVSRSVTEDVSLLTGTGIRRGSGISSTSGTRGAFSDLENPAKIEFSLGGDQGFSTYGSSVAGGTSSSRRTGVSSGIGAVSGGAERFGGVSGLSGTARYTGGVREQSGRTGEIRGSGGLSGTAGASGGIGFRATSGATRLSGGAGTGGLSGTIGTRGVSGTSRATSGVGSTRGTEGALGGVGGGIGTAFRSQRTSAAIGSVSGRGATSRRSSAAALSSGGFGAEVRGAQLSSGISETAGYTSYEGPSKVEFLLGGGQGVSTYGRSGTRGGIASVRADTTSDGVGRGTVDSAVRSRSTLSSSGRTSQRTSSSLVRSGSGGTSGYVSSEGPAQIEFFLGDGQGFSTYGASGQGSAASSRGGAGTGGAGAAGVGGAGGSLRSRGLSDGASATYRRRTSDRTSVATRSSSGFEAGRAGSQISTGIGARSGYTSPEDSPAKIEFFLGDGQGYSTYSSSRQGSVRSTAAASGGVRARGSGAGAALTSRGSGLASSGIQRGVSSGGQVSFTSGETGDQISSGQSAGFTGTSTTRRSGTGASVHARGSLSGTSRTAGLRTSTVTQTSSYRAGAAGSRGASVATSAVSDSDNPAKIEFSLGAGEGFSTFGSSVGGGVSATRGAAASSEVRGGGAGAAISSRGTFGAAGGSGALYGGRISQRTPTATRTSETLVGSNVGRAQVSSSIDATSGYTINEGPSKVEFLLGSGQSSSSRASGQSGVTSAGGATVTGGGLRSRSSVIGLRGTSGGSSGAYSGGVSQRTSTSRAISTSSYTASEVDSQVSSGRGTGGAGYISADGPAQIEFYLDGGEGFSTFGTSSQREAVSAGREVGVGRAGVRSRGSAADASRFSTRGAVATRSSTASYDSGVSGPQVARGDVRPSGYTSSDSPAKIEFQIGDAPGFSTYGTTGQVGIRSGGVSGPRGATGVGGGAAALRSIGTSRSSQGAAGAFRSAGLSTADITAERTSAAGYSAGTSSVSSDSGVSSRTSDLGEISSAGGLSEAGYGDQRRSTTGAARGAAVRSTGLRTVPRGRASATRSSATGTTSGVTGATRSSTLRASSGYTALDGPAKIEFRLGDSQGFSTYGTSGQAGGVVSSGGIRSTGAARGGSARLRSRGTAVSSGAFASGGAAGVRSSEFTSERVSSRRSSAIGSTAGVTGARVSSGLGAVSGYTDSEGPGKIEFFLGDGQGFSTYGTSSQTGGAVSSEGITGAAAPRAPGAAALRAPGAAARRASAGLRSRGGAAATRGAAGAGLSSSGFRSSELVSSRRTSTAGSSADVTSAGVSAGLGAATGYTTLDGPGKIEFFLGDGQGFSTRGASGQAGVIPSGGLSAGAVRGGSAGLRSRGAAGSSGAAATRSAAGLSSSGVIGSELVSSRRTSTAGSSAGVTGDGLSAGLGSTTGYTTSEGPAKIEFFLGDGQGVSTRRTSSQAGVVSSAGLGAGAARGGSAGLRSRGTVGSSGAAATRGTAGLTSSELTSSGGAVRGGSVLLRSQGTTSTAGGITSGRTSTSSRTSAAGSRSGVSGARITSSTIGTVRDYSSDDNPAKILFNLGEGQGFSTFGASGGATSRGSAGGFAGVSAGGPSGVSGTGGVVRTSSIDSGISLGRGGVESSGLSPVASVTGQRRGSSRQEELRRSQAASISGGAGGVGSLDLGGYSGGSSGLSSGISYTSPPKPGVGEVQQQQVSSTGDISQQKLEQIFV